MEFLCTDVCGTGETYQFLRLNAAIFTALGLAPLPVAGFASAQEMLFPAPERGFVSSEPAETWEQGLICGNGTICANALSRPLDETIIFSHERLFMPEGEPVLPPQTAERMSEIRALIAEGKYLEATELFFDLSDQKGFMYPDRFVPAFDFNIQMEDHGEVTGYSRSVNFATGEATVRWADERGAFERRLFVSRKDGMAVLSITGPGRGNTTCRLAFTPRSPSDKLDSKTLSSSSEIFKRNITNIETTATKDFLTFRDEFAQAYTGSIQAIEGVGRIVTKNGKVTVEDGAAVIEGADKVMMLVDIRPLYKANVSELESMQRSLSNRTPDYDDLLAGHAKLHGELFNRMRLDLGGGEEHQTTTEVLLSKSTYEEPNLALIEKEFDAGRYNILSCTGELPPTLQGGWGGTYVPGWASDFTHNGNVPAALASMLMGNMPELMLAYTSYIESIVPGMEENAKRIFGARGVVLPSRTTTHGYNNAFNPRFAGGFWVAGAPWAAHFFYDYYLYTGDRQYLAEHALPFMEKAAVFFEDYLYEGRDGKYIFSPTQSPENTPANSNSQASFNATMTVAAVKELLHNCIAASRELAVNQEKIPVWEGMLEKMPPYLVGPDGALKEWLTPALEDNHGHRHASHLYPLYDGIPEEIAQSPELRAAFKRVIEIKLEKHWKNNSSGFMSFGVAQLGMAAASLGESELAYQCLRHLVNRYWLHNLASMHNHKTLFNMDISGGMPAVIIKMLVASEPGVIQLLPALPSAWPSGAIEGVLCRGQIAIRRLAWDAGRLNVVLHSAEKQSVELRTPSDITSIKITDGDGSLSARNAPNIQLLELPANGEIALEIVLEEPAQTL